MKRLNISLLPIDLIETVISDHRKYADIEKWCNRDYEIWTEQSPSNGTSNYYVRNNAKRIRDNLKAISAWYGSQPDRVNSNVLRILEVGIGYGEMARSITVQFPGCQVYGLEHPGRCYLSREFTFISEMKRYNVFVVGVDFVDRMLPFKNSSFDIVLFCEVVEHLPSSVVPMFMVELSRVVRPGGALVVALPNLVSLHNRLVFLAGKSVFSPAFPLDYAGGTFGHIRLYTIQEMHKIAERAGFDTYWILYSNAIFPIYGL